MMLNRSEAVRKINALGASSVPFLFFTDFRGEAAWVKPMSDISSEEVSFSFGQDKSLQRSEAFTFTKSPLSFEAFKPSFDQVTQQIRFGNSFLVNLTFRTPITTNLSLREIFELSGAKYKLLYRDQFVVFSPETFVQIRDGHIFSYPMKGTIDAAIDNAENCILNDPKETAEHVTIVDLIRNDLSRVAHRVEVSKFRFITEVKTHEKKLLQVSSEIVGELPPDYLKHLGSIIFSLLPAGSISGAPKTETVKIIEMTESHERGFYTGICGMYDGKNLDSGVMIRFIENDGGQLFYKSGGGITSFSQADKEYQEIIDKVYLPVF